MTAADWIALSIATPLAGTALIWMSGSRPNQREIVTVVTSIATFLSVLQILPEVLDGGQPALSLLEIVPGLPLAFRVEPLGMMFGLIASFLWIVTSFYSMGYMRDPLAKPFDAAETGQHGHHGHGEENLTRFFMCFAIAISSALAVAFAADMLTLFIAYEALTLSTYPLVTHHQSEEAKRAGRTYLGILMSTSIGLMLIALLWTWQETGTLEFTEGGILRGKMDDGLVVLLLFLYMYGIGKAALMPIHRWLPAAMVAPTPVSALLHAVAVVKAGVFTVLKVIIYIFGADYLHETGASVWLMYAAGATILLASLVALTKDNLKARLAYSTVSQLSYVVLAGSASDFLQPDRRGDAHRNARLRQDHAVLLRRCGHGRFAQDRDQRDAGPRTAHAIHFRRLPRRRSQRYRAAAARRLLEQMVHRARSRGS